MSRLYDKLVELQTKEDYPFHMPGHKRNMFNHPLSEMFQIDITEIDGFDNLHHSDGILKEIQDEAAVFYHTKKSYFLVNGSTCGILASISALLYENEKLLLARNSHKAAYHGAMLNPVEVRYIYPKKTTNQTIFGDVSLQDVELAFKKDPDIKVVFITSPNYDGIVSNIAAISEYVHSMGAVLVVDEAHGAHFSFCSKGPKSAIESGADIVIQSLHKTLPALTQTAILHVCSERIPIKRLERYLAIYQTSSPSYVFLATMEQAIKDTYFNKETLFDQLYKNIDKFYNRIDDLQYLRILDREWAKKQDVYDFDRTKILIDTARTPYTGQEIYDILRNDYHLQMEMAGVDYVLALTSIKDSEEGFLRLADALLEIDIKCKSFNNIRETCGKKQEHRNCQGQYEQVLSLYKTAHMKTTTCKLECTVGKISGEYLYLYPPGIPIIVPGEQITPKILERIEEYKKMGLPIQGCFDYTLSCLEIIE